MDWTDILKKIAPVLGAALPLPPPLGPLAVQFIADKVLGKPDATQAEVVKAMEAPTPEMMLKLKEADQAFNAHMAELGVKLEELAVADRASARSMQIATRSYVAPALAVTVTLGFFGVLAALLFGGKPDAGGDVLLVMLGALGAAWANIIGFYFGSSQDSHKKTEALANIAQG